MTIKRKRFTKGIELSPEDLTAEDLSREGELAYDSSDDRLKYRNASDTKEVIDSDSTQTLENKTIDATAATGNNSLSADSVDIVYDDTSEAVSSLGTNVQDALDAVKVALDNQNDASEINYDNTTSGLTATDVQAAIDEVEDRVDTAEADIVTAQSTADNHIADATDAHTASAITNVPSGNLAATDVQGALNEIQTELDGKAVSSEITDHINDPTDAHAASAITNTPSGNLAATNVQGALDELQSDIDTRATDADLTTHTGASSGVHGVTGNVVGDSDTQTLTNKTVSGGTVENASIENPSRLDMKKDTLANLQTYAASATNGQLVYATDAKKTFQVVDAALVEVGSGDGSVNYIENSDFEQGIDGYTDDVNFTIAQTELTAEILRGSASAKLSKAAVDASDEEISVPFTVDRGDLAKKLTISFEYDASDANYADNDILIGVRQDPNGTPSIIRINGEDLKGGKGTHYAQFQTDASIDEYELFFKVNSTNASAYDIIIDDVKVGPRELAKGTIVTDWIAFTPTFQGLGTVTSLYAKYRRSGDSLELQIKGTSGTSTGDDLHIGLPSSLLVDSDYNLTKVGTLDSNLNNDFEYSVLATGGDNFLEVGRRNAASSSAFSAISGSGVVGSTNEFGLTATVKIQGWSSNAASSEDLGGREVVVQGAGNGGTSLTTSVTPIDFTETRDTTASWDGTTFTATETGEYLIMGSIQQSSSTTGVIYTYLDTGSGYGISKLLSPNNLNNSVKSFNGIQSLNKGDKIQLRVNANATIVNNSLNHHIHIQKLASPQTILETETVAARYTSNSGQSVNIAGTDIVFEDIDFDTHNAYNTSTGIYTIPTSGYYDIKAQVAASVTDQTQVYIDIFVDGSSVSVRRENAARNSALYSMNIAETLYLEKGQEVNINYGNTGNVSLTTNPLYNTFSINRIK